MTTQEIPAYRDPETKIRIGAGTAIKVGFFFALGVTLFSVVMSIILGVVAVAVGIGSIPIIHKLLNGG